MNSEINKMVEKYKNQIVQTTQKLIKIQSFETEAVPEKPFGDGIYQVLNTALDIADSLQLDTANMDNYAGHVEIGSGEDILGILTHLDVVPAGDNWNYPPFGGEVHNNKIYGRGAIDDKGPTSAILFALKIIKDLNIKLNKKVRLILGTDEESGWEGIDYYFKKAKKPKIGFSPDANFPVIHAEKGVLVFKLSKKINKIEKQLPAVQKIVGGNAPNMVPDTARAEMKVKNISKLEKLVNDSKYNIDIDKNNNNNICLKAYGKSAHGSLPENGENAISKLMLFLDKLNLPDDDIQSVIQFYCENIGDDYYGKFFGCDFEDSVSGNLVLNVGEIDINHDSAEIIINIRYPVTYSAEDVYQKIKSNLKNTGIELEENMHMEPLFVPKDDKFVKELMKSYNQYVDDNAEPVAIGGGTYARALDKGVAFGPLFPGSPKNAHQADESIDIDELMKAVKIYTAAIISIAGKE